MTIPQIIGVLEQNNEAFRLTREYVEPKVSLPAIQGWTWYDAVCKNKATIRELKANQFKSDRERVRKTLEETIPVRLQGKVYDEIADALIGVLK